MPRFRPCHVFLRRQPPHVIGPPTIISLSIGLQCWVLLLGLFDLGWVLRFVYMVGCGLVVTMVLWLRRQFGGCGGVFWVVFFWVFVVFFFFFQGGGGVSDLVFF